jgi:hypothetical protein
MSFDEEEALPEPPTYCNPIVTPLDDSGDSEHNKMKEKKENKCKHHRVMRGRVVRMGRNRARVFRMGRKRALVDLAKREGFLKCSNPSGFLNTLFKGFSYVQKYAAYTFTYVVYNMLYSSCVS